MSNRESLVAALEAGGVPSAFPHGPFDAGPFAVYAANIRSFVATDADLLLPLLLAHASPEAKAAALRGLLGERELVVESPEATKKEVLHWLLSARPNERVEPEGEDAVLLLRCLFADRIAEMNEMVLSAFLDAMSEMFNAKFDAIPFKAGLAMEEALTLLAPEAP